MTFSCVKASFQSSVNGQAAATLAGRTTVMLKNVPLNLGNKTVGTILEKLCAALPAIAKYSQM